MMLEKFLQITSMSEWTGDVDTRIILLDIDKVVYFSPFIKVNQMKNKTIEYTEVHLINSETIKLKITFEEIKKRLSI